MSNSLAFSQCKTCDEIRIMNKDQESCNLNTVFPTTYRLNPVGIPSAFLA
jgi:hypothetical protein